MTVMVVFRFDPTAPLKRGHEVFTPWRSSAKQPHDWIEGPKPTLDNRCQQLPLAKFAHECATGSLRHGRAQLPGLDRLEALAADQFGGLLVELDVFATSQRTRPFARKVGAAGQAAK